MIKKYTIPVRGTVTEIEAAIARALRASNAADPLMGQLKMLIDADLGYKVHMTVLANTLKRMKSAGLLSLIKIGNDVRPRYRWNTASSKTEMHHATKKSPAQLQREIDDALTPGTRKPKQVVLAAHAGGSGLTPTLRSQGNPQKRARVYAGNKPRRARAGRT